MRLAKTMNDIKPKMGRPKLLDNDEKTMQQFEALMGIPFVTCESICHFFKVSESTLVRWIKDTYDGTTFDDLKEQKKNNLKLNLAGKQYETAMKGNVVMQIWLGKNWLGQTDKQETTIAGEGIKIIIDKDDEAL
jgi:hypothetical protein